MRIQSEQRVPESVNLNDSDEEEDESSQDDMVNQAVVGGKLKAKGKKLKVPITGNMKYLGKDRVCPAEWPMTIMTTMFIIVPTVFVTCFTSFGLGGMIGGWFIAAAYLLSFLNLLRIHHNCRNTEPGILPRIRSKKIDYNKTYYVRYRSPGSVLEAHK